MYVHSSSVVTSASSKQQQPDLKSSTVSSSSKKNWKQGTKELVDIFQSKDEEISHWMSVCKQQEQAITQLELIREQKNHLDKDFYSLRQVLNQRDNEIDQLQKSFSEKEAELNRLTAAQSTEIERLRQHIELKNSEMNTCKQIIGQLEHRVNDIKLLEVHCRDKDIHIATLNQNLEEQKQQLKKAEIKVEELRRFQDLAKDQKHQIDFQHGELNRLNSEVKTLLGECEAYRARISEYELQVSQMRALDARLKEHEKMFSMMTADTNKLNEAISIKMNENQDLRERLKKSEAAATRLKVFEDKSREQENQLHSLSNMIADERKKNGNLARQLEQLEHKLVDKEGRIEKLQQEMDRLRDFHDQKINELQACQERNQMLELGCTKYENQICALSSSIEELTQNIEELSKQQANISRQNDELHNYRSQQQYKQMEFQQHSNQQREELERQRNYLQAKEEEINSWKDKCQELESYLTELFSLREKNKVLSKEIDRLTALIAVLEQESQQLKLSLIGSRELQEKQQNLLIISVQLFAEVESLRARVKEKEKEVAEIRNSNLQVYRQ